MSEEPTEGDPTKVIKIAEKQATQITTTKRRPPKKGDLKIGEDDHLYIYIE